MCDCVCVTVCARGVCERVCMCVVCLCVCVLSSWHSLTNLSSIQIFHSDGKRPQLSLGSVANF